MVGSLFKVGNSRMYSTNATPWMDNKHAILDKVMKKMDEVQCVMEVKMSSRLVRCSNPPEIYGIAQQLHCPVRRAY
ncbi:hypothetical protein C5167_008806 [Papaver somniferum]|uniref:Uncharacterized protein n=1 Tax=Papaver somniferum TaxID=3469 RepID=A0A4Y7JX18_PAPSO|nr:hypothetical protein C5167_008806 [Papaver somniferum]